MVVVTGATGHLGNVLVRELVAKGKKVKAIYYQDDDTSSLEGLANVTLVPGDILDLDFLIKEFNGQDKVYHLAGLVNIQPGQEELLQKVNVEGTRNVVKACLESKVKKLGYVSSSEARYAPEGNVMDEICGFDPERVEYPYQKTKAEATLEVLKGVKKGLNAVIVSPSGIIGPYDFKPSLFGNLIIKFTKRRLLPLIKGSYDFVDVRDVAHGLILAAEKKKNKGENYILSGKRISITHLMDLLHVTTGKYPVSLYVHYKFAKFFSRILLFRRKIPELTPQSIDILQTKYEICHEKAEKELGYTHRSITDSIKDAYSWLKYRGKLITKISPHDKFFSKLYNLWNRLFPYKKFEL